MKKTFDVRFAPQAFLLCFVFILMLVVQPVEAREIAGVDVPPSVTIDKNALVLNGAGIRKKLFIKVYVATLYLTAKRTTVGEILADPGAKSIVMTFLYKEVSAKRTVAGWNKGFADNSTTKELKSLQGRINLFNSLFSTVYKGDVIRLDYLPDEGTKVWINDTLKGSVPGADFYQALLKIWLGSKPADAGLKDDWLGNSY